MPIEQPTKFDLVINLTTVFARPRWLQNRSPIPATWPSLNRYAAVLLPRVSLAARLNSAMLEIVAFEVWVPRA